jgi:hypothetical protein
MMQRNGNDAFSHSDTGVFDKAGVHFVEPEETTDLFDELGSVSTVALPRIDETGEREAETEPSSRVTASMKRRQKRRHRWMMVIMVVMSIAAICVVTIGIYLGTQHSHEGFSASAEYSTAISQASKQRSQLKKVLNDTKESVAVLTEAVPEAGGVEDFSQTWSKGEDLIKKPPRYFATEPQTEEQDMSAQQDLNAYNTTVKNVTARLTSQNQSVAKAEAEAFLAGERTTLQTAVTQSNLVLSNYEAKNEQYHFQESTSSASGADAVSFDTTTVRTVKDSLTHATALLEQKKEGTPSQVASVGLQMRHASDGLTTAYDALQKSVNDASAKAEANLEKEQALDAADGAVPEALIGSWKTPEGTVLTFTQDSLQDHHAVASRLSDQEAAVYGNGVVAAWKLTSGGVDQGIEDTVAILYSNDGIQSLSVKTASNEWKLTR